MSKTAYKIFALDSTSHNKNKDKMPVLPLGPHGSMCPHVVLICPLEYGQALTLLQSLNLNRKVL